MNRNNILGISTIAALGVGLMTNVTVGQSAKSDKERFIGTWTLVSITSGEDADQTLPYGPNPRGTMMVVCSLIPPDKQAIDLVISLFVGRSWSRSIMREDVCQAIGVARGRRQ